MEISTGVSLLRTAQSLLTGWTIEALKIQNFSRGRPPKPPLREGEYPPPPSLALPILVPSALDGFLRRTTFEYAATALQAKSKSKTLLHQVVLTAKISKAQVFKPSLQSIWDPYWSHVGTHMGPIWTVQPGSI